MKKLLFIDNDFEERTKEDIDYVKAALQDNENITDEILNNMESISNFHHKSKEEAFKILIDPQYIICTWSMYTWNHFGSLYQLTSFLSKVGRYEIKGLTYFDASGNLLKTLNRYLNDSCFPKGNTVDYFTSLLKAIATNHIITANVRDMNHAQVKIDLTQDKIFVGEPYTELHKLINASN